MSAKREVLQEILNGILSKKKNRQPLESLEDSLSLTKDVGLDSIDLAEMTVHLEDRYGVDVFQHDIVDAVGEVLQRLP